MASSTFRTSRPSRARRGVGKPRAGGLVAIFLSLLGALALFVAFILPSYVPSVHDDAVEPSPASPEKTASAAAPRQENDPDKLEVEKLRTDALRRVALLENEGARIWGGEPVGGSSLGAAEELLANANRLQGQQQYADAVAFFRRAIGQLDQLRETKQERLRLAVAKGQAALEARDAEVARRQFELADALAPGDAVVAKALDSARKLPKVLIRLGAGETAEAANDLPRARDEYQAALALDPDFDAARANLRRVEASLAAREYRSAVTEAHARLNENNIRAAEAAFARAQKLNPKAPEIDDLRQRIGAASRAATLERLRTQAAALERQEKWAEAVRIYDQVLAIDKNAAFAGRARSNAQTISQLHSAIDSYLAEPARLQSADSLAHAKTLLSQSIPIEEGHILATKKKQLAQQVTLAQTPVSVSLRSDQNTEVEVYRIGKLGKFDTRRIELRPGRYVAVGTRAGYRDVRVQFDVSPIAPDQAIVVQCTEQIR